MNSIYTVLRKIEALEGRWTYTLSDKEDARHSFGRVYASREIGLWSVPPSTGALLRFLVLATNAKTILELGTSAGYSTLWMALAAEETGGHIYATEILPAKVKLAKGHFKEAEAENLITLYEKDILEVLENWSHGVIDFVFIDAHKKDYLAYYEKVLPLLRKGGVIVADNAIMHAHLMQPFLKKVETDKRVVATLMDFGSGLMLIYKK